MGQMKTPGVYIHEKSAFPNSVVEVATAVPAFIGYTEMAVDGGKSILNKPQRITSMAEFRAHFGGPPMPKFSITKIDSTGGEDFVFSGDSYTVDPPKPSYMLYYSMLFFYQNGGGPCYIVSVGTYDSNNGSIEKDKLAGGITPLVKEHEPTMLLIPEAVRLSAADCVSLQQAMVEHCGNTMKSRVAIVDVYDGYKDLDEKVIDDFRNNFSTNYPDFAITYYPWLNTTIVGDNLLSYLNIANLDVLIELITKEQTPVSKDGNSNAELDSDVGKLLENIKEGDLDVSLNKTLLQISPIFNLILKEIKSKLNLLPPSSAIAGVYTAVDNNRGVWKAPANVSLNSVISTTVNISNEEQENLNVDLHGKSINAIRPFIGEGILVWGARTLDGNSQDWRYINVRRTMIMLEQSIKMAAKAYVFEPNVANTWVAINAMITNFLTSIWKQGGLAGAAPTDAFSVHVGLGETMTANDILDGIMRITVLVAISRPAEFIEITFQQQMQKS